MMGPEDFLDLRVSFQELRDLRDTRFDLGKDILRLRNLGCEALDQSQRVDFGSR